MRQRPRNEQGSALLLALMAMVFLTVIGLSLAVVTETEMLIGTNEQVAEETFFAAEAGVATAVSQILEDADLQPRSFALQARQGDAVRTVGDRTLGYVVEYTSIYPVAFDLSPYSDLDQELYSVFFYTRVRARRMAWPQTSDVPNCQSERDRAYSAPPVDDSFNDVQAEDLLTLGFYGSPLQGFTAESLTEGFFKPDTFGCAPPRPDEDYIQKVF